MKAFYLLSALLGAALALPSQLEDRSRNKAGFTKVHSGKSKIILTKDNTLNATANTKNNTAHTTTKIKIDAADAASGSLPLKFVNNFSGGSVNAYITGLDSDGKLVFVSASGGLVYPSSGGSTSPVQIADSEIAIPLTAQGSTLDITLPVQISSGRVYFAEGSLSFYVVSIGNGNDGLVQPSAANLADPSRNVNWGFVEFTYANGSLASNISYVDFVGMILGMVLTETAGSTLSALGLAEGSVAKICSGLSSQNSDGYPWSSMCLTDASGNPLRVVSPNTYTAIDSAGFANYYTSYIDSVWTKYASETLTLALSTGSATCQVSGNTLNCNGDDHAYPKPVTADVWGCNSGPFVVSGNSVDLAAVPVLCAAFVRSTLLLDGGNVQPSLPSSSYYTVEPTNHYSRLIHSFEVDGKGYAFPYDDVNPDGENASGLLQSSSPSLLTIYVGAPPSS